MYVVTSAFSALTSMFLNGGPVISVDLSIRPGARIFPCQTGSSLIFAISGKKSNLNSPESSFFCTTCLFCSNCLRLPLKVLCNKTMNSKASLVRISATVVFEGSNCGSLSMSTNSFTLSKLTLTIVPAVLHLTILCTCSVW